MRTENSKKSMDHDPTGLSPSDCMMKKIFGPPNYIWYPRKDTKRNRTTEGAVGRRYLHVCLLERD